MMEGKIYFESVYGEGTVFVVELTLAKGGSTSPKAREHTSSSVNIEIPKILPTQKYSGRILVAEDNQTNQKVIERMLQKRGCKFLIVANGNEVLKALGSGEFNLILMDCQMPEMDGYETTRIIRSSQSYPSTIPIVALTANAIQGDEEKCMECGMDDYISKPINQRMLDQALQKYLNPSMSPVMSLANPENRHSQCGVSRPASPLILSSVDVNALALLQNNRYQGRSDLIRLIDSFLEACPQTLALVEHCLAESEFHRIGKEAFYLKLSAQAFGAQRLAELCQKMHDITLLDNQRVDLYADIFPKVKSELENVVENLQSIKASPSLYTS